MISVSQQLAKHFRDIHFGGNWTVSNLRENLEGVTWQQATTRVLTFNTMAALVFHMNYFVAALRKVLEGGPLDAHDKYSFDLPPITSATAWNQLLEKTWDDAEKTAALIEQLPDQWLGEIFFDTKYGTYYRNIAGTIEHCHYHLAQVVMIRKMLAAAQEP